MKSLRVTARGTAEIIDVPAPEFVPGHALIHTSLLSLCGSDIWMLHHAADAQYPFPMGTTGHEMVGFIEEADPASGFQVGDRVLSLAPGHRAMCEYYLAPLAHIIKLPDEPPMELLLQAQQLGTVIYAAKRLPNLVGKNVVVIGQGSAGLWFNYQLRRLGARRVLAMDLDMQRLKLSQQFGATHVVDNALTSPVSAVMNAFDGDLADLVVEAAGEVDAINLAIDLVRKHGEILYFGVPRAQTFPFNFDRLFHKNCRAQTCVGSSDDPEQLSTRMAIDLIVSGEADPRPLITHHFAFDDVVEALELHRTRGDGAIKIVVTMPA